MESAPQYSNISDLDELCFEFANDIAVLGYRIFFRFKIKKRGYLIGQIIRHVNRNYYNKHRTIEKELLVESFSCVIGSVRRFLLSEKIPDREITAIVDRLIGFFSNRLVHDKTLTLEESMDFCDMMLISTEATKYIYDKKLSLICRDDVNPETLKSIEHRFETAYHQKLSTREFLLIRLELTDISNLAYPKFMKKYEQLNIQNQQGTNFFWKS